MTDHIDITIILQAISCMAVAAMAAPEAEADPYLLYGGYGGYGLGGYYGGYPYGLGAYGYAHHAVAPVAHHVVDPVALTHGAVHQVTPFVDLGRKKREADAEVIMIYAT